MEINPGDRVEVTRTKKGGYYVARYLAPVIRSVNRQQIRVRDDAGKEALPYLTQVKKLS